MYYLNGKGEKVVVSNEYYVDILPELEEAGRTAIGEFRPGWFPAKPNYPAGIVYQLGTAVASYAANRPASLRFTYYFEVRAVTRSTLSQAAMDLCGA